MGIEWHFVYKVLQIKELDGCRVASTRNQDWLLLHAGTIIAHAKRPPRQRLRSCADIGEVDFCHTQERVCFITGGYLSQAFLPGLCQESTLPPVASRAPSAK